MSILRRHAYFVHYLIGVAAGLVTLLALNGSPLLAALVGALGTVPSALADLRARRRAAPVRRIVDYCTACSTVTAQVDARTPFVPATPRPACPEHGDSCSMICRARPRERHA